MQITRKLSELICETQFAQFPSDVLGYSKSLVLSALGAMVAGAMLPTAKIMTKYIQRMGGNPEATVMGAGFRSSVENAAMAMGLLLMLRNMRMTVSPKAYQAIPRCPLFSLLEKS